MAETPAVTPPTPAAAAVAPPSPAPAATEVASSPASVAPVVAEAPKAAAPAAVEAPKAPDPAPVPEKSLLGAEPPKSVEPPKAAEPAPPAEAKKEEAPQSDKPAPLPTYEWKLPEGVKADDVKLGEFTKEVAEFEVALAALPAEERHAALQTHNQKLVDRHISELHAHEKRITEFYQSAFDKQKSDWKTDFEKDSAHETRLGHAIEFISTHGGSAEQQKEIRQLMDSTGIGNNKAIINLLANAQAALAEGKPVPAAKPPAPPQSKVAKRYGGTT